MLKIRSRTHYHNKISISIIVHCGVSLDRCYEVHILYNIRNQQKGKIVSTEKFKSRC